MSCAAEFLVRSARPLGDGRRLALRDVAAPSRPRRLIVRVFHGHEQGEVVQPARLLPAKAGEAILQARGRPVETIQQPRPQRAAMGDDERKVDISGLEDVRASCLGLGQELAPRSGPRC